MIKSYKKFTNKKLDKTQLDELTKNEVDNYREAFITKSDHNDETVRKYLDELELYIEVRFKEDKYQMFDKWVAKSIDNEEKGIKDELLDFNVSMLEKEDGYDMMYYLGLIGDIKRAGVLEYIKGIDINIPEKWKGMFRF